MLKPIAASKREGNKERSVASKKLAGLSPSQNRIQVLLRIGGRVQIVGLHQCFDHGFRQKRRQRRSKVNILHAERKQRQQDAHRLLLVPGQHKRERQVVDRAAERIRQCKRNLDGAVRIVALAHIQNARQAADFAQIEVIEAVFAARKRQNQRIHRRGFDKLGVVISARMRAVTAADQKDMPHLAALDERDDLLRVSQHRAVCKARHQHMPAVNAAHAVVVLVPAERERLLKKQAKEKALKELLDQLKGKPNVTKDGRNVMVYCNIGSPADIDAVLQNDGGGIGLFRSEFLYLQGSDYPTEDEQFEAYKTVAERMGGKRVIIRTLDIGADKQADYFHLDKEENPAMGLRAIRICLTRPEVFRTQLRALYRASAYGKIAIMFPMITSVWEVQEIKRICRNIRAELAEEGVPMADKVELGIMIETPAAVMMSAELAHEVDFFSVGTNDLTQYTLAVDRQGVGLDRFFDAHHPAVLRMIRMAAENAHKAGIWIGICGELGADAELTETFLSMGIDELSVSPSAVLPLRSAIRSIDTTTLAPLEL